jgi:hypothetical protein
MRVLDGTVTEAPLLAVVLPPSFVQLGAIEIPIEVYD